MVFKRTHIAELKIDLKRNRGIILLKEKSRGSLFSGKNYLVKLYFRPPISHLPGIFDPSKSLYFVLPRLSA